MAVDTVRKPSLERAGVLRYYTVTSPLNMQGHKWVEIRSGKYKLVDVDDPRPAVTLNPKKGVPAIHIAPPWKKFEAPTFEASAKEQRIASDKFQASREHYTKTDKNWDRWEKSRKASLAKDKPAWVKKRMSQQFPK